MKKIDIKIQTINPELAQDYLKTNNSNRNISKRVVNDYARQMKLGLWKLSGDTIKISKCGRLLDGQHRLLAVIESNTSIDFLVVNNLEDNIFDVIDTGKTRTVADMCQIKGIKNANNSAAVVATYFRLKNNYSLEKTNLREMHISKQELVEFSIKHDSIIIDVNQIAARCYKSLRIMKKSEIGGYILYLFLEKKHKMEVIDNFFKQLFNLSKTENTSIELLKDKMVSVKLSNVRMNETYKKNLIVKVWNNYIKGNNLTQLRYNKEVEGELKFI